MKKWASLFLGIFLTLMISTLPSAAHAAEPRSAGEAISRAKASDRAGFDHRLALIRQSRAFMDVLKKYTSDQELNAEFFAAVSTDEQAAALVKNTKGKHYVVSGTQADPVVTLVDGPVPRAKLGVVTNGMPACPKAWVAFSAWLVGTTMLCAPFSGPAAWACAVAMGLLGLMPDFNKACR